MNKFAHIELDETKLAEQTLRYVFSIENTYLESSLFISLLDPTKKYKDLKDNEAFIRERLSMLHFIVDLNEVVFENGISRFNDDTHEQAMIYRDKKVEKENFSKEIFWASENEEVKYQSISHFKSFEEKIIPQKKLYNIILNSPFFNVKGWIEYYQKLLDLKFSEFSERIVSGKTIIKYKPFKGKYFLGIETDYQFCKNNFKKGWWEQPDYKLIIFEKANKKSINKIVVFQKFVHPHFNPPSMSFAAFFGSKTMYDVSEKETVIDDGTRKEFFDDGTVRLYNSEEFGDELKRHAYFYYDMLYHTTKEYIKFIEDSFED